MTSLRPERLAVPVTSSEFKTCLVMELLDAPAVVRSMTQVSLKRHVPRPCDLPQMFRCFLSWSKATGLRACQGMVPVSSMDDPVDEARGQRMAAEESPTREFGRSCGSCLGPRRRGRRRPGVEEFSLAEAEGVLRKLRKLRGRHHFKRSGRFKRSRLSLLPPFLGTVRSIAESSSPKAACDSATRPVPASYA